MVEEMVDYEQRKQAIRQKKVSVASQYDYVDYADDSIEAPRNVDAVDVLSVGSKIVIGGGVGLLAGVAAIAVVASAAEIILAGVVTKIAGIVGGALGLTWGLGAVKKKKKNA